MEKECPVDCKIGNFTPVGECSKPCGGVKQQLKAEIIVKPNSTGTPCPSLIKEEDCNVEPCSLNDCKLTNWSEWTPCPPCGKGTQSRTREIIEKERIGGKACSTFELREEKECNILPCPVDCMVGAWGEWSDCSSKCGGGIQKRERKVIKEASNRGAQCPLLMETREC